MKIVKLYVKTMKLKPLSDHVIVKPITEDEVTKSGIVLPDTVDKEKPEKGRVEAVGEGKLLENGQRAKMSVKAGDIVMFKKYSPDEIKVDGEEYLVIQESDVLAIIDSNEDQPSGTGGFSKDNKIIYN